MIEDGISIKGNKEGINVIVNVEKFKDFEEFQENLLQRLSKGQKFYKGASIKITANLNFFNEREFRKLKDKLFDELFIQDCIFEGKDEKPNKIFSGVNEGKTKFIRNTIRGGQRIDYSGNVVIIGDVNPGAEVRASGNIIVFGVLKGHAYAGVGGNEDSIVAAFSLHPEILQICDIVTRAPEEDYKPQYPEVARLKESRIIVEPYIPNKYF